MAFVCLGPTSSCQEVLFKMSGHKASGEKHDKSNSRSNQHDETQALKRAAAGGGDRGVSLQTKISLAAVAKGEDDADIRDQDRALAVITSQISSHKELMMMYSGFATAESNPTMKASHIVHAQAYEKKILELTKSLSAIASCNGSCCSSSNLTQTGICIVTHESNRNGNDNGMC